MSDSELRIKIAELCGIQNAARKLAAQNEREQMAFYNDRVSPTPTVPDYLNDLNAMHEAESYAGEHLFDADQWAEYAKNVERAHDTAQLSFHRGGTDSDDFWYDVTELIHATARQRAEAFIKTIEVFKNSAESPTLESGFD